MTNIDNGVLGLAAQTTAKKEKPAHNPAEGGDSFDKRGFAKSLASFGEKSVGGDSRRSGDVPAPSLSNRIERALASPLSGVEGKSIGDGSGRIDISIKNRGEQPDMVHSRRSKLDLTTAAQVSGTENSVAQDEDSGNVVEDAGNTVRHRAAPHRHSTIDDGTGNRDRGADAAKGAGRPAGAAHDEQVDGDDARPQEIEVDQLLTILAAPSVSHEVTHIPASDRSLPGERRTTREDRIPEASRAASGARQGQDAAPLASGDLEAPAGDLPDGGKAETSDTDRIFRLIRSDGKGREAELSLSANGEKATVRDASSSAVKAEAVTVLEARRYIGLAQTGNAAAVTAAIAQDPEWASSLTSAGGALSTDAGAAGRLVNTLKIQMHPIDLGMVTATLRLSGDELVVSLQVQTGEAYRQLSEDQDSIVKSLRAQGFAVEQVTVQLSPADRSASAGQDGGAQPQFTQQQEAREGGNGRQNGGQQAPSSRDAGNGQGDDNGQGVLEGGAHRSQRPGGVYL